MLVKYKIIFCFNVSNIVGFFPIKINRVYFDVTCFRFCTATMAQAENPLSVGVVFGARISICHQTAGTPWQGLVVTVHKFSWSVCIHPVRGTRQSGARLGIPWNSFQ